VGLCGELAGDPLATPILLGLGLDEFSMAPTRIPVIKQVLRELHKKDCVELAEKVVSLVNAQEVIDLSRSFLADRGLI
jgi:phosphotransferase system enzyme I (PtsI)